MEMALGRIQGGVNIIEIHCTKLSNTNKKKERKATRLPAIFFETGAFCGAKKSITAQWP